MRRLFINEPHPVAARRREDCDHGFYYHIKPDRAVAEYVRYCRECGSRSDDCGRTWVEDPEAE